MFFNELKIDKTIKNTNDQNRHKVGKNVGVQHIGKCVHEIAVLGIEVAVLRDPDDARYPESI